MQQNLISDLTAITAVPTKLLNKFVYVSELCICDYMNELDMTDDDVLNLDIGIGIISFLVVDDTIQYSFAPSKKLEEKIITTIEEKSAPLIDRLENNLENKLIATYKELV